MYVGGMTECIDCCLLCMLCVCYVYGMAWQMPSEVVLVRKFYPRRENQRRMWTLMHLPMEKDAGEAEEGERGGRRMEVDTRARDLEDFKREIEEDVDMRQDINLYRDPRYASPAGQTTHSIFRHVLTAFICVCGVCVCLLQVPARPGY